MVFLGSECVAAAVLVEVVNIVGKSFGIVVETCYNRHVPAHLVIMGDVVKILKFHYVCLKNIDH